MKRTGLSFFELVILCGVLVTTAATSKQDKSTTTISTYGAATDCANANQNNVSIVVTNNAISSPAGISFMNFGLPAKVISINTLEPVSAQITNGPVRSCTASTSTNNGATMYVYTCTDNSVYACTVTFTVL
jgi:hypothetical protein